MAYTRIQKDNLAELVASALSYEKTGKKGAPAKWDNEKLFAVCKQLIKDYGLLTFADLTALLGMTMACFYREFPSGSSEHFELEVEMQKQKIRLKSKLRTQWQRVKAAAPLQLAAYKLMATDEEREALNSTYNKNEHAGSLDLNARIVVESVPDDMPELPNSEKDVKD